MKQVTVWQFLVDSNIWKRMILSSFVLPDVEKLANLQQLRKTVFLVWWDRGTKSIEERKMLKNKRRNNLTRSKLLKNLEICLIWEILIYRCCSWTCIWRTASKRPYSEENGVILFLFHIPVRRLHSLPVQILTSRARELPTALPSYKKKVWSASDIDLGGLMYNWSQESSILKLYHS